VLTEENPCLTVRCGKTAETKLVVVVLSMAQLRSGEPPKAKGFIVHSTVSYANLVPSSQLRGYRVVPNVHTEQEGIQPANCLKAEYADDVCCLWSSCPKISAPLRPLVWEHGKCFARLEMKRLRRLMRGKMLASSVIQDGKVEESRIEETRGSANCRVTPAVLGRRVSVMKMKLRTSLDAYKAATRPKMARRPAPVADSAVAAPSKGGADVDSVGAPVPEGAGATMGIVPLADG
jgi:hypothetical protein